MLGQLVQPAVAGDAAGDKHILRQPGPVGEEPGRLRAVHRSVAGHVEQRRRRGPADRRDDQVTVDLRTVGDLNRPHAAAAQDRRDVAAEAGILDPCHLDASPLQVGDRRVAGSVSTQHDGALPRPHGVQVDEPANRRREHDAWQVIALDHVGALDQARRRDECLGPRLDQPLTVGGAPAALQHGDPVTVVAPEHDWDVGEHFDAG